MSSARLVVLVVATALIVAGGVATVGAELGGARVRQVRRKWLDAAGVLAPYAGLAILVWWVWQRA